MLCRHAERRAVRRTSDRPRETLLLRLLGARTALHDAIRDLAALPDDAWERSIAMPWLVRLSFMSQQDPSARAADQVDEEQVEEEEIMAEIHAWFEQLKQSIRKEGLQKGLKEGFEKGLKEGQIRILARQFEKKLGRPLSDAEQSMLAERLDRLGLDRLDDVRLELSANALAAWLAEPAAR